MYRYLSTIANLNSTITTVNATQFENGTIPLPSLPVGGNTTVLPDGTLAAGGSEGGALANMAQVILRVVSGSLYANVHFCSFFCLTETEIFFNYVPS